MKKVLFFALVAAVLVGLSGTANAAGNISLGIGGNVLLPMGDFGDVADVGFGGTVRGQYMVNDMFSVTLTSGYLLWSGKDQTVLGVTVKGADIKGVPVLAGAKYYFGPSGGTRFYGLGELGFMFTTVTVPSSSYTIAGITFTTPEVSASETDFSFSPGVGVELPMGSGNSALDIGVHFFSIGTSGTASNSIGGRVAYNFGLGN